MKHTLLLRLRNVIFSYTLPFTIPQISSSHCTISLHIFGFHIIIFHFIHFSIISEFMIIYWKNNMFCTYLWNMDEFDDFAEPVPGYLSLLQDIFHNSYGWRLTKVHTWYFSYERLLSHYSCCYCCCYSMKPPWRNIFIMGNGFL